MAEHSPRNQSSAKEWLDRARLDADNARSLHEVAMPAYDNVGFLCQQATDKLLKGYLVPHGCTIPKTHDIRTLLVGHIAAVDADLARQARLADELTPYAVAARSPSGFGPVSRVTAAQLIAFMERPWALFEPRIQEPVAAEEEQKPSTDAADEADGDSDD